MAKAEPKKAKKKKKSAPRIPAYQAADVPVSELVLDTENPRLASREDEGTPTQDEVAAVLWSEAAVDEIAFSIAANGFYRHEPLLVVSQDKKAGGAPYVVVEGNRRLAAVRLLRDKALRERVKATELPQLSATALAGLDRIPVQIFPNRKGLWAYLGFRHVNGTKQWDALSKAEFVAKVHDEYGVPLEKIAEHIGDRHSTVSRLYRGYTVLKQAEEQAGFARADLWKNRFHFSHLYTAIDQAEFQDFLGIKASARPSKNPVTKGKLGELEEFMTWLYGKKSAGIQPVVRTQAPDLNSLRRVIGDKRALSLLRQGVSLTHAYEVSKGDVARFRDALSSAKDALQRAKGTLPTGFRGERDLVTTMEEIVVTAQSILVEMKQQQEKPSGKKN